MQFGIRNLLLAWIWIAISMAGFTLGGGGAAMLISLFLGMAMLLGTLTYTTWPTSARNEKRVGVFATAVAVAGLMFLFFALVLQSQLPD